MSNLIVVGLLVSIPVVMLGTFVVLCRLGYSYGHQQQVTATGLAWRVAAWGSLLSWSAAGVGGLHVWGAAPMPSVVLLLREIFGFRQEHEAYFPPVWFTPAVPVLAYLVFVAIGYWVRQRSYRPFEPIP